jgi:hypothetical protein
MKVIWMTTPNTNAIVYELCMLTENHKFSVMEHVK